MGIKENPPVNIASQMGAETVGRTHTHTHTHICPRMYENRHTHTHARVSLFLTPDSHNMEA